MKWLLLLIVVLVLVLIVVGIVFLVGNTDENNDWVHLPFYKKLRHLGTHPPDYVHVLADKYAAKDVVKNKCANVNVAKLVYVTGDGYLPELDTILDSDKQYIMKANNASTRNKKIDINSDIEELRKIAKSWIKTPYTTAHSTEKFYSQMSPKVLIEELIHDIEYEYRILCFHGRPKYIKVKKVGSMKLSYYTPEWEMTDLSHLFTPKFKHLDKPEYLDKMLSYAEQLSQDIAFVCVDIMATKDGTLYFCEFTFTPNNSSRNLNPYKYQEILSNHWLYRDN